MKNQLTNYLELTNIDFGPMIGGRAIQNPTSEINKQGISCERSPDKKILLLRDVIYRMIENCFSDSNNSGDSSFKRIIKKRSTNDFRLLDRLIVDENCGYTIPCGDNDVSCTDSFSCQDKNDIKCNDNSIYCHDTQCAHVGDKNICINNQCTDSDNCINSGSGTSLVPCQDSSCTDTSCINGSNNPISGDSCIDNTNCADNEDCTNDNGCWDDNCTNDECHNDDCNNTTSCSDVNCINDTSCTDTDNKCSFTDCINTDC